MVRSLVCSVAAIAVCAGSAAAGVSVSTYESLSEGFYGSSLTHNGVTYRNVNDQPGVFPDGGTFDAEGVEGLGNEVIVENATFLYNDFPGWGSPTKALTFGSSFVPGDNLTIGAMSTVWMDLAEPASAASVETVFYENGPWGGIVIRLDAVKDGVVVASDAYTLSDLGGRDNIAFRMLSVSASSFDQLHLYATFGQDYSGPRMMIDNLTLTSVPGPGAGSLLALAGLVAGRRRR